MAIQRVPAPGSWQPGPDDQPGAWETGAEQAESAWQQTTQAPTGPRGLYREPAAQPKLKPGELA